MIEKLKELGWKKTGGFLVMAFVAFAFIFGGFGGGFSTNNQNNIAKINKTPDKRYKIVVRSLVIFFTFFLVHS